MSDAIKSAIELCEWGESSFFIFSSNVFAPLIYYSHLGVIVIALFFGFFVYLNKTREIANRLLFLITISLSLWLFSDLVLWANEFPKYIMFFWSLEIILEPIIYILSLYFFYTFVDKQDISWRKRLLIFSLIIPTLLLVSSDLALSGFDLTNCDRVALESWLPKYGYLLEIFVTIWIVVLAFNRYKNTQDRGDKKKIFITAVGIVLFLFSFSLGNIAEVLSENWYIGQIGYIGAPIFIALLCYEIVKFREFKIKILSSQVLVASLWFLTLSILFVRKIENVRFVVAITLALFSILGIYLIRSVKREVEQRERIEKLAKDLEVANEKLRGLDQLKTEFLSLATHQIRSPLTAIKGYSSMLLEGDFGALPVRARESVKTIFASCQHLINIVEDFLNISRIEQGRMTYNKGKFDLKILTDEAIKELSPNIEKKDLKIEFRSIDTAPITVDGDRNKIKQVLHDVIDNAIKYTKAGQIEVQVLHDRENAEVVIKDTGVGMDQKDLEKLFVKFSRASDAYKHNVSGTGLGLYIAQKMIEAHNGKILAQSLGRGKGSTFTIVLPLARS